MSATEPDHGAEIAGHIERVAAIIATARERLAEGKLVDLAALEEKVFDLHAAATAVPAGDAAAYAGAVADVQSSLHALGDELDRQFQAFQDRFGAGARVEAARAYARPPEDA